MHKVELLSPAKNYNTAISAINCGADAIYIGASDFGARKAAGNSIYDIEKIVKYAHLFNVKVYVTINTILSDSEIAKASELIKKLYEIKVDAIIIQDFAILLLAFEKKIPPIVLHMSTQCDNRTLEKIKFFEDIGIKRVILARELSIDDIAKISKNINIELEHFIHGSLCACYSGNCYMSAYIGSRSANRGDCSQPCRKKYTLIDKNNNIIAKNQYLLSLKDNNLSNHLDKLIKANVKSFKIEGRLKDENYVKNTVLFYHKKLKNYPRTSYGKVIEDFNPNPFKTFNRSFCDDYLFNKKDNIYNFLTPKSTGEFIGEVIKTNGNSFTVNTNETINPQDGLCFIFNNELTGCLVNSIEKTKKGVKIFPNKKIKPKLNTKVYRNIDFEFEKTLENSTTTRKLSVYFEVFDNKIKVSDDFNNKVELLFDNSKSANNSEKMCENFKKSLSKTSLSPFLVEKVEIKAKNIPFLPISTINELRREILEKLKEKILQKYKTKKQKPIDIAKFPLEKGDYRLNVHNKKSQEFYELCGCKVTEKSFESLQNKSKKELMRMRHCLKKATLGCNNNQELFLVDEKNKKFPLIFDCKNCEMVIMSD